MIVDGWLTSFVLRDASLDRSAVPFKKSNLFWKAFGISHIEPPVSKCSFLESTLFIHYFAIKCPCEPTRRDPPKTVKLSDQVELCLSHRERSA